MKRILVVNVNWVGDVIFSTPIFKSLKKAYPNSYISCMAPLRVKEILECVEGIDEVIVCDESGQHKSVLAKLKLILDLRKRNFDAAFLLHRSLTRALIVFLAGIPERIGYDTKGRGTLLTHKVEHIDALDVHRSEYYLNVVESYGVKVDDRRVKLISREREKLEIVKLLEKNGVLPEDKFVVVNCGGNWDLKRWPKKYFVDLIDKILIEYRQEKIKVVISGAPKDVRLVEDIVSMLSERPVVMTGNTTLKQLVALMSLAELLISADSGPMHIANSVGTDVIAIFGPTRPENTGPIGEGKAVVLQETMSCNKSACYNLDCEDNVCMKAVAVDDVFNEVKKIVLKNC